MRALARGHENAEAVPEFVLEGIRISQRDGNDCLACQGSWERGTGLEERGRGILGGVGGGGGG